MDTKKSQRKGEENVKVDCKWIFLLYFSLIKLKKIM